MDDRVSRLSDISGGDGFRSPGMRVEDTQQFKPSGLDPVKGSELFIRIHHETHGTSSLILHEQDLLHPVLFSSEQTTRLERRMKSYMVHDSLDMILPKSQLCDHVSE